MVGSTCFFFINGKKTRQKRQPKSNERYFHSISSADTTQPVGGGVSLLQGVHKNNVSAPSQ